MTSHFLAQSNIIKLKVHVSVLYMYKSLAYMYFFAVKNYIKYEQKYFNLLLYNILIQVINVPSLHPCARSLRSLVSCSYICKNMNISASHRDAALFRNLSGNHIQGYVQG